MNLLSEIKMNRIIALAAIFVAFYLLVTPSFSEEKTKPKSKSLQGSEASTFTADWRDTELKDFLMGMSAIIKRNILIDDSVKGKKVTIISQRRIKVDDAFSFMKSVLESQGFGLIEENDLIKVVKIKDALAKSPLVRIGKDLISENDIGLNKTITQIVPLEFANANELEPILKRVTSPDTDIIIPKNQNTLLLSGSTADINKLLKLIDNLDVKLEGPGAISSAGDIHIYTLEYNEAEKLAAILVKLDMPELPVAPVSGTEPGSEGKVAPVVQQPPPAQRPGGKQEKIKAVAHKESNSLIVTALPGEWEEIKKIIKVLDSARKQVLLEVLIVELTSTDLNDFGIDWRYQQLAYGQYNTGLAAQGGVLDKNGRPTNVNTLSGFSLGFIQRGGEQIIGILNANSTNENFNVLSAPQILTLDNQEAEINVGQDVPVRTQNRNAGLGGDNAVTVANFEYRPTGIKLKFTPHINKNNRITLDLYQEIKNVAGISSEATGGNPTFNKRDIKTTIVVDNVQTIVIGGLLSNDKQKKVQKIPLLGEIPLIGNLFRRTTNQLRKTNLMVFLTPHILEDREKSDRMTIQKKNEQERMSEEREKRLR
jgi:general secretion pathway protein D